MAFNMDVDNLDKEKVTEVLNPTPVQKQQLSRMADENKDAIMAVDLDSLEQRREIAKTIDKFANEIVERSS